MSTKTHTVIAGDRLINISRKYYGYANKWPDIVKANSFLQDRLNDGRVAVDGSPLIYPGDVLIITPVTGEAITNENVITAKKQASRDVFEMFINGEKLSIPEKTKFIYGFDSCNRMITSNVRFNPEDQSQRDLWKPEASIPIDLFAGGEQIFGGTITKITPKTDAATIDFTALTHTNKIVKSVLPPNAYPLERENESLFQICEWACGLFGLSVIDEKNNSEKFKKAKIGQSEQIFSFLNKLAMMRSAVLAANNTGTGVVIKSPSIEKSVASFVEGVNGFKAPQFNYDMSLLCGEYFSAPGNARKPSKIVKFNDENFDEKTYGFISLDDSSEGNAQESLDYQALKKYRDFFSATMTPGQGLFNPNGDMWEPGQLVTVTAPSQLIYDPFDFLIRKIEYDVYNESVILHIMPPAAYLGEKIEKLPWN